jgi:hypothetical protein
MQAKLAVSAPGDVHEREADRVADEVTRGSEAAGHEGGCNGTCDRCRPPAPSHGLTARPPASTGAPALMLGNVVDSGGQPLDAQTRDFFEARFGYDFARVRVHSDDAADRTASAFNAHALTYGHHITFSHSRYQPATPGGRRLLAHELTHVVQQGASDKTRAHTPVALAVQPMIQRAPETIGGAIRAYLEKLNAPDQPFAKLAAALGADPVSLTCVLLDPQYDLKGAVKSGTFRDNLKLPSTFASCYPTAKALFPVLTGKQEEEAVKGTNPETFKNGDELRAEITRLASLMRTEAIRGRQAVYRIEFAGHGFTLVARRKPNTDPATKQWQMELIESLAGRPDTTPDQPGFGGITRSLTRPPLDPDAVIGYLHDMGSDKLEERIRGASEMGWNAQAIYLGTERKLTFNWWAQEYTTQAGPSWTNLFKERFNFLAGMMGTERIP